MPVVAFGWAPLGCRRVDIPLHAIAFDLWTAKQSTCPVEVQLELAV